MHGGAWTIPDDLLLDHQTGMRKALVEGWKVLERGGSSLDAIEAAVITLEDEEAFDAGRGSILNRDGRVQMDALIMEGKTLRAGGVGCVERIRNPIKAARLVLDESPHVYFVAEGAELFAAQHGLTLIDNSELVIDRERKRLAEAQARERAGFRDETFAGQSDLASGTRDPVPGNASHDTVGAIALDSNGNLAAATSTGGTLNKAPGRVGDSSLVGCGCYADNQSAAVSLTGWGEPIMKLVLGKWAVDRVASGGDPEAVAQEAIGYLNARLNGHAGIILLDQRGRCGVAHNTPYMAWGIQRTNFQQVGIS